MFDSLEEGWESEIISSIFDPIFEAPIGRLDIIGCDSLVECSSIILILGEGDFPVFQ